MLVENIIGVYRSLQITANVEASICTRYLGLDSRSSITAGPRLNTGPNMNPEPANVNFTFRIVAISFELTRYVLSGAPGPVLASAAVFQRCITPLRQLKLLQGVISEFDSRCTKYIGDSAHSFA